MTPREQLNERIVNIKSFADANYVGYEYAAPKHVCFLLTEYAALRAELAACQRELTQARDERNELYNATVTLKGQLAQVERERDRLSREITHPDGILPRSQSMHAQDILKMLAVEQQLATALSMVKELEAKSTSSAPSVTPE
jgi:chromosome segregation ATPase